MRLVPHDSDRFHLVSMALAVLAGLVSIAFAVSAGAGSADRTRSELSERSQTIAAALPYETIAQLQGTGDDDGTAPYILLKQQLAAVKKANPDTRSIYLMGRHNGQLFFYVDSEEPGSRDYSSAGEAYNDGTAGDKAMFDSRQPLVEGPVSDEYGTFISGLAPILRPNGSVAAVLGIDVASSTFYRNIAASASLPLLTGLSFILIIIVFESMRRRNAQLLALRSELVSVASHELRNPITGVRWAAESLEKNNHDQTLVPLITAIKHSAEGLQASTEDILALFHAMSRRKLEIRPTDFSDLIRGIFAVQELSAKQQNISLELDTGWPAGLVVWCDAEQMKRVLHNVISNAIKYTKPNSTVTVGYTEEAKYHAIWIKDEGIGIPADEQSKVFRGFYRASNAVASKVPGTGLGLFMVKAVLESHGGNVTFNSEQDKGSTFTLHLPKH
jgi:signal transduction histidine kinase